MIENDKEFKNAFNKYLKSEGIEENETYFCGTMQCDDCVLKDVSYGLDDIDEVQCSGTPFKEIEKCEKKIKLLKQEIEIMNKWEEENKILTKETWEEEEKLYAEIQRLITKNGELTKEIARLYRKLDQMEKKEKENG